MTVAFLVMLAGGLVVGAVALAVLRWGGARPDLARRLAGPPEVKVGRLLDPEELQDRPIRVAGRIRCRDPLVAADGERLVAFHRDVEVRVGGRWRSVERMRETRSFDLWDHDGSLQIDPARAAEPLITIPQVWRGEPAELAEPHASAVKRLEERHGPATTARAVTRSVNVTDRLLVLARPVRDEDGRVRLEPPQGGFLITTLGLAEAMRLLGGRHRAAAVAGVVGVAAAIGLIAIGAVGLVLSAALGA